ncbi:hypothetical protein ACFYY1_23510 [Streptomyces sp. NPDC001890]|uniref:hypothetical protein n=1 Tax=Streptomyces sp. NPDC001890 TaxID=3364620 RepID=UPI003695A677
MEAELAALAASGATALLGHMVSDAWTHTRDRVARFLARGEETGGVDEELEASRAELIAARDGDDPDAVADIEDEWRLRMRRALRADPAAAQELRLLLDEIAPRTAGVSTVTVNNNVSGGTGNVVNQGQNFSGLTFHGQGRV